MADRAPESATIRLEEAQGSILTAWSAKHVPVTLPASPDGAPVGVSVITSACRREATAASAGAAWRAGLSRAALSCTHIEQSDRQVANPPTVPRIFLEVWSVTAEVASHVVSATWAPTIGWGAGQFLLQVQGLLCEGFELRACVDPTTPLPTIARALRARMQWVVDREPGGFQVLTGPGIAVTKFSITKA